jgi:hypothetical protein
MNIYCSNCILNLGAAPHADPVTTDGRKKSSHKLAAKMSCQIVKNILNAQPRSRLHKRQPKNAAWTDVILPKYFICPPSILSVAADFYNRSQLQMPFTSAPARFIFFGFCPE